MSSFRSSASANAAAEQTPTRTSTAGSQAEQQQPPSARSTGAIRTLDFSPSARTIAISRVPSGNVSNDQPPSARAAPGRPSGLSKVVPMVPPSVPITLRPASSMGIPPLEPPFIKRDRRYASFTIKPSLREQN